MRTLFVLTNMSYFDRMKKSIVAFVLFMAFQVVSVGQSTDDNFSSVKSKKNFIYGTVGAMPNIVYDLNYERQVASSYKSSINLRLGYGGNESLVGIAKMALLSTHFIYGLNASRVEFGLGLAYLFDIQRMNFNNETEVQPVANFGYRYVQQNGPFVFRIGAGWPECIYASVGFAVF